MKNMSFITILSISILSLFSCKKEENNSSNNVAPTNLTVNATVSADSSGNVAFVASATNATTYEYGYGDGTFEIVPSGVSNYKYSTSGTYSVNVIATSASGLTTTKSIQVTVKVVSSVFWSEEFNIDGAPDPSKWGYDLGRGNNGWGNNELQYYTARTENAIVQGGVLKIKLIKESYNSSNYTSARLISKNKFAFKYGKVDILAKLPAGGGTWPALWMLGSDIDVNKWPACGEIDIMEHKGNDLNKIFGTLHYPGHFGGSGDGGTTIIADATTKFHKYSLDWSASSIKISVDDVVYKTVANSNAIPFNHDFFFILNVAMGGDFGGTVDPNVAGATMEVDYIRVYK
jgi:Glycosyl hydrolases family 16/PKD domain